jgi:hypothetical protein
MATLYQVQPGDTVAGIAHKLSGNPALSRNLVLSNPHKPWTMHNGQPMFQTLYIGEHLRLPNSLRRSKGLQGVGATDAGGTDTVAVGSEAIALNDYLTANGCDSCSQALAELVYQFQKTVPGLAVDAKYGANTQKALTAAMGATAPSACYSAGGPCFGNDAGPNAVMKAHGATPPGGGGTVKPGGNVTPVSTLTTTGATNWLPWAIGIGAIVLGGVLVMAMQKNKKEAGGHPAIPSAPEHRALPAHTASKSGHTARRASRKSRKSRKGRRKYR